MFYDIMKLVDYKLGKLWGINYKNDTFYIKYIW